MIKINTDYLLRLVNNDISSSEILTGYMRYYVAQGRNIGDMKHDYMRISSNIKYINLDSITLSSNQIENALSKTRRILDKYLIFNFNCQTTDEIEI
ncbi:hypothetical protein IMSAGC017_01945 [Thomasclavelia cocleata]|uniref:Uncharacterized protein n=1 Tax=Thomasclavelia cocleata TaxID=69824 RepID=A0A829ZCT5_9FIRM|nr:hypothetical protein [Thomasclavelia cocleata]GFI41899.1 hypothetical protein IMSAGC017_01945 [Thomasclavelia cocleata]